MGKDAEGRVIEVRRTSESDPDHPISTYHVYTGRESIKAVVHAMADALHPEQERMPSWCIQVIYRPDGIPATSQP